jgi:hypothetical protein
MADWRFWRSSNEESAQVDSDAGSSPSRSDATAESPLLSRNDRLDRIGASKPRGLAPPQRTLGALQQAQSDWRHNVKSLIMTRGDRGYCGKPRLQPR